ncbi:MAG: gluconokinase, partial [Mesorhizobium sp.]
AIGRRIAGSVGDGQGVVAACSALKRSYRERLRGFCQDIVFLYLEIDPATAKRRVGSRQGHFMPASLVDS